MLDPITPHLSQHLWWELGKDTPKIDHAWPEADPELLIEETVEIAVQINGKLRANVNLAPNANQETFENKALADVNVQKYLENKDIKKIIFVPGRLINIVI